MVAFSSVGVAPAVSENRFVTFPAGKYEFSVVAVELKDNTRTQGSCFHLLLKCLKSYQEDSESVNLVGALGKMLITHTNPDESRVMKGKQELALLCQAIGVSGFNDERELVGKEFVSRVTHWTNEFVDRNGDKQVGENNGFYPVVREQKMQAPPIAQSNGHAAQPAWMG